MGYSSSHKGYKCLSSSGRIYISKDFLFNELRFPILTCFPLLLTPLRILIPTSALIPPYLHLLLLLLLKTFNCLSLILLLYLLFPMGFPLFQLIPPQPLFLCLIHPLPLNLSLFNLEFQSPLPPVHPLQSLFQHLILYQLIHTLCKQGPNLEFTILDYILLYFLPILNLKL